MSNLRENLQLELVLTELERAGIKPIVDNTGKHLKVKWKGPQDQPRMTTMAYTSTSNTGALNARGRVRRQLKEDGMLPNGNGSLPHKLQKPRKRSVAEMFMNPQMGSPVEHKLELLERDLNAYISLLTDMAPSLTAISTMMEAEQDAGEHQFAVTVRTASPQLGAAVSALLSVGIGMTSIRISRLVAKPEMEPVAKTPDLEPEPVAKAPEQEPEPEPELLAKQPRPAPVGVIEGIRPLRHGKLTNTVKVLMHLLEEGPTSVSRLREARVAPHIDAMACNLVNRGHAKWLYGDQLQITAKSKKAMRSIKSAMARGELPAL